MPGTAREDTDDMFDRLDRDFGPDSGNRIDDASDPDESGVLAALDTFYHGLNHADLDAVTASWADDDLVSIDNPVGGIVVGRDEITALYGRIFASGLDLRVTLTDVIRMRTALCHVVAGREVGSYLADGRRVPLKIRTSRVLARTDAGWRLVHHHGSIDDPEELAAYQRAVAGG